MYYLYLIDPQYVNRFFLETILAHYHKRINNISFFIESHTREIKLFARAFGRRLVNIAEKRLVSQWPGTVGVTAATIAYSCRYDNRLRKVFLNRIAPYLFGYDVATGCACETFPCSGACANPRTFQTNGARYYLCYCDVDGNLYYEPIYVTICDLAIVSKDGVALFSTTAHEELASLALRPDELEYFQKTLHIDKPPFWKPKIIEEGTEEFTLGLTYRTIERGRARGS